jgi:hypothetical protein
MPKGVLYIGMDESNHGETKPRIGEVVVATCSYNHLFWDYKKSINRRNFSKIEEALNRGVNYFYTILPHELAKENYSNLPLVAPFFVTHFLKSIRSASQIRLGLDGQLNREDKGKLMDIFSEKDIQVNVLNFIKKNGVHYGPELIYLAHLIANSTMNRSLIEIAGDDHFIPFNIINL